MDNLIEDIYTNRPDDDDLAFIHYEKLFRDKLDSALFENTGSSAYDHFTQTYINNVLAVVKALELNVLPFWVNNPERANDSDNFRQIKFDIDAEVIQIKIRYAQRQKKKSVYLAHETKEKIRDLIGKIKTTIDSTELETAKKEALFKRLNDFVLEVDKDRTKFEAIGELFIGAAGILGKAGEKAAPIRKWIDSIANLMHEAQETENTYVLFPKPRKQIQASSKPESDKEVWSEPVLDDEIPF